MLIDDGEESGPSWKLAKAKDDQTDPRQYLLQ